MATDKLVEIDHVTEYISRQDAMEGLKRRFCDYCAYPDACDENAPCKLRYIKAEIEVVPAADVVEVVRCGECIHRTSGWPSCQGRPKDWFCANGQRGKCNA